MGEHARVAVVANDDDGERAAWLQDMATATDGLMVHGYEMATLSDDRRRDLTNVRSAFIDASSWLVRDPLACVSIGDEVTTVWWSVRRDHVGDFLDSGYLVAEIEPESFDVVPEELLVGSAPAAVQLALTVPLHRRTLIEAPGPVESVDELCCLTTERVVGTPVPRELGELARRLWRSGGYDMTAAEIETHWSVVRHADVVGCLAGRGGAEDGGATSSRPAGRSANDVSDVSDDHPHLLALPSGGSIAETPTTVRQFARFVDAGSYDDPTWWLFDRSGAAAPEHFAEQRPFPDRPVVGVGFAEAEAYGAWLGAKLGRPISLPTHGAWREACGHEFPWGDDDHDPAERANFGQLVGDLTDVGEHPLGAGPHGHLDLAGNCWEWLADPDGAGRRVVVGGGWFTRLVYLRSNYAFRFDERNRFRDLGFRVACPTADSRKSAS